MKEGVVKVEKKEIVLANITSIIGKSGFVYKNNSTMKKVLKCAGLGEYFDKYSEYLIPYWYNNWNGRKYENSNDEYDVFLGLDYIFSDLYQNEKHQNIMELLKELTRVFNVSYIEEYMKSEFNELKNLYRLMGLDIELDYEEITVSAFMKSDEIRIKEVFSVEAWLNQKHLDVYDSYDSAITSYMHGQSGACIESCRTAIVSIFSKFKGTEGFAKWFRGIFNVSGDSENADVKNLDEAIKKHLRKEDLAEFFNENSNGKLTKTKTIYMIYSMMSDYGTHRNESTQENPTQEDALFMLRLTDSILLWLFSMGK